MKNYIRLKLTLFPFSHFLSLCTFKGEEENNQNDYKDKCHRITNKERVIGGQLISIQDIPYIVSLQDTRRRKKIFHICSGVSIGRKWILSTGSCVSMSKRILVKAGVSNLKSRGLLFNIKRTIIHPNFNAATSGNNLALLELRQPLPFNRRIHPIELPDHNDFSAENGLEDSPVALVAGWGETGNKSQEECRLRAACVPIYNREKCEMVYSHRIITSRHICAGFEARHGPDTFSVRSRVTRNPFSHTKLINVFSLQGDEGSPLVFDDKLIGIHLFGKECGISEAPEVYVRISEYVPWIRSITKGGY